MPFNDETVLRIREFFLDKGADFYEKKMFGGICFMVDNKMCCATHLNKKTGEDMLMCRIGPDAHEAALEKDYVVPMEFTGKPMIGYIYVYEGGFSTARDLTYWLQLCLDYNPVAKASKK